MGKAYYHSRNSGDSKDPLFTFILSIIIIILFILGIKKCNSQCVQVQDAVQLKNSLLTGGYIYISKDINLGELSLFDFPLVIKKGTHLSGNFDIMSNPWGTKIFFPYEFINGTPCKTDLSDRYLQFKGFAFEMKDSSEFSNLRLVGVQDGVKDWRYFSLKCGCPPCKDSLSSVEGLQSGIIVTGKDCKIHSSEFSNFSYFAVQVVPDTKGSFYFERNYIHDNKELGYGYGVWLAGGRGTNLNCQNVAPVRVPGVYKSNTDPDQNNYIKNCVFWGNKHHIAGSGDRNSYFIDSCTFGLSGDFSIDRHNSGAVICNPGYKDTSSTLNCYKSTISDVGGNITSIKNSIFYKSSYDIGITYPNINDCVSIDSSRQGLINIQGNTFIDATKKGVTSQIQIADVMDYHKWNPDPHIRVLNNEFISDTLTGPLLNLRFYDHLNKSGSILRRGEFLRFNAKSTDMMLFWKFYRKEIRSKSDISYQFNQVGITNISVMGITKDFKGSNYVNQVVQVYPDDSLTYLVFNIKDTYIGKVLDQCKGSYTDTSLTGFIKYASIDGAQLWSDDIQGDEGWQRVQLLLDLSKGDHTVEIGVKAEKPVRGNQVRGFNIFIDDVYINNSDGTSCIQNGDMEATSGTQPLYWVGHTDNFKYYSCTGETYTLNSNSMVVSTSDNSSGVNSFSGYIRPFRDIVYSGKTYQYLDGLSYVPGKYRWITQNFKIK